MNEHGNSCDTSLTVQGRSSPTADHESVRENCSFLPPIQSPTHPKPRPHPTHSPVYLASEIFDLTKCTPPPPQANDHLAFILRPKSISHVRRPLRVTRVSAFRQHRANWMLVRHKDKHDKQDVHPLSVLESAQRLTFSQGIPSLLRRASAAQCYVALVL